MIAADTSTWIAFFQGEPGEDVELLDRALKDRQVLMAPPVLTELLSDPGISSGVSKTLCELPLVEVQPGFWERAGALRGKVLASSVKPIRRCAYCPKLSRCWHSAIDPRPRFPRIRRGGRPDVTG